jgi:hypothetical protein
MSFEKRFAEQQVRSATEAPPQPLLVQVLHRLDTAIEVSASIAERLRSLNDRVNGSRPTACDNNEAKGLSGTMRGDIDAKLGTLQLLLNAIDSEVGRSLETIA